MGRRIPPERYIAPSGGIPLAAVIGDRDGLVSYWSNEARLLFGLTGDEAHGIPVIDLLPVAGALTARGANGEPSHSGPDLRSAGGCPHPTAGRAHLSDSRNGPLVVLWWVYPLVGPGPERLLVLIADATRIRTPGGGNGVHQWIAPGFAPPPGIPGADPLSWLLPEILSGIPGGVDSAGSSRIVSRVLELGCPVLEIGQDDRVPSRSRR